MPARSTFGVCVWSVSCACAGAAVSRATSASTTRLAFHCLDMVDSLKRRIGARQIRRTSVGGLTAAVDALAAGPDTVCLMRGDILLLMTVLHLVFGCCRFIRGRS